MGQEAMVVEAVQAGIKDFIVKPFKEDRLMKTVNSILGNPWRERANAGSALDQDRKSVV